MARNPNRPGIPNTRKYLARPVRPTYAGGGAMTEKERYDHIQGFQRFGLVYPSAAAVTGTPESPTSATMPAPLPPGSAAGLFPMTQVDRFTTDGATTSFTVTKTPLAGTMRVEIGGVDQDPSGSNSAQAWSYSNGQVTFTTAPSQSLAGRNGAIIYQFAATSADMMQL
jgi:hypothetical protein